MARPAKQEMQPKTLISYNPSSTAATFLKELTVAHSQINGQKLLHNLQCVSCHRELKYPPHVPHQHRRFYFMNKSSPFASSVTWKDLMKVQSSVRMPSPRLSSFTRRITRNKRKKLMLNMLLALGYNGWREKKTNIHTSKTQAEDSDSWSSAWTLFPGELTSKFDSIKSKLYLRTIWEIPYLLINSKKQLWKYWKILFPTWQYVQNFVSQ